MTGFRSSMSYAGEAGRGRAADFPRELLAQGHDVFQFFDRRLMCGPDTDPEICLIKILVDSLAKPVGGGEILLCACAALLRGAEQPDDRFLNVGFDAFAHAKLGRQALLRHRIAKLCAVAKPFGGERIVPISPSAPIVMKAKLDRGASEPAFDGAGI